MPFIYNIYFEVAAAIFLMTLIIYIKLQYNMRSEINKEFYKLVLLAFCADVMDVTTAVTISYAAEIPYSCNLFFNSVYFVVDAFVGYQFMYYSRLCVDRTRKKSLMLRINRTLLSVYLILLGANLFSGCIFYFDADGVYSHGSLYLLVYFIPYYFIGCSAYVLLSHLKKFQRWQKVSIILYLVLALARPVIQMLFFQDVLLGLFFVALALMMILFTMETPDYQNLVVDDDEMNRAVVKGLLKQTKVRMDFAESGEQCLERMADCHYDVILLDHMMPGMDGMETLAQMRKRYPNESAKVIALTANAISGMRQMYLDSGFDDYMTKPIDGGALEKLLMNYIPEEKIDREAAEEEEQAVSESGANQKEKAASDQDGNGSISLGELQEWKTAVPELDVLLGLEYSIGDKEFYTEMLRMFAEQSKLPMLNEHYGHADWGQYHTLVHALKSTALSIVLVRLSEQARQLEYAAKRGDAAYITAFHSEVMEYYGECIRHIQEKLAAGNGEG